MIQHKLHEKFAVGKGKILALGGGGARGLAHIGVIKVLEKRGWIPDLITGTSMGAFIGALYALEGDAAKLEKRIHDIAEGEAFQEFGIQRVVDHSGGSRIANEWGSHIKRVIMLAKLGSRQSILSSDHLNRVLDSAFGDLTFEDLQIPFVAIATDLLSGEDVELSDGKISRAIAASGSIPGVFEPVKYGDMLLVDGCVTRNVPVPDSQAAKNYRVVAVDVPYELQNAGPYFHAIDVLTRSEQITQNHLNRSYLLKADEVITPNVRHIHWADFSRIDDLIKEGERAAFEHFNDGKSQN